MNRDDMKLQAYIAGINAEERHAAIFNEKLNRLSNQLNGSAMFANSANNNINAEQEQASPSSLQLN